MCAPSKETGDIKVEFSYNKDFFDFAQMLKDSDSKVEICINSDLEITLTYSNDLGSISISSFGNFAVSTSGPNNSEIKINMGCK